MLEKYFLTYKKNFKMRGMPILMQEMLQDKNYMYDSYVSSGFCFADENSDEMIGAYLEIDDESFLEKLIFISYANKYDGIYAFFVENENIPVDENPIIFIGVRGEISLVASNFCEFLQLLSIGCEAILEKGEIVYSLDGSGNKLPYQKKFHKWLLQKGIKPLSPNSYKAISKEIVLKAQIKYEKNLKNHFKTISF